MFFCFTNDIKKYSIMDPMNKRQFYRVNDSIPLTFQKMPSNAFPMKASFIPGALRPSFELAQDEADLQIDPALLRILTAMDSKLNLILERLSAQSSGLACAETRQVNLSEGGICLTLPEAFSEGDRLEFKLMLPTIPYSALLVCGEVERVKKLAEKEFETAVKFLEMEEDVRDVLSRYILQRQRGTLRNQLDYLYASDNVDNKE